MAKRTKALAIAEHLAKPEPKLPFFVCVGDALDLADEYRPVCLPGKVEVGLLRPARAPFDPRLTQDVRERVLSVGMACRAPTGTASANRRPGTGTTVSMISRTRTARKHHFKLHTHRT
jgi:hypothetical protein